MGTVKVSLVENTKARGAVYRLLALLYAKEPSRELLRQLTSLGIEFEEDFSEIAQEYTRLFIGPGRHISAHESVHCEDEGLLWGKSTVEVKDFIESSGLKYRSDFKGIPDHVSVEFEFMHRLIEAELEAREKNETVKIEKILDLEKRFINEHLLKWIPRFADKVAKEARVGFYKKIAQLTKEFILATHLHLVGASGWEVLWRRMR